jgi:hypothetical protein
MIMIGYGRLASLSHAGGCAMSGSSPKITAAPPLFDTH